MNSRQALLALALIVAPAISHAESAWTDCDVDDYAMRAIGIEEPWLENALYLTMQAEHKRHGEMSLSPEIEARLGRRVGLELDVPEYHAPYPVGSGGDAFGPLGAGIKYAARQTCDMAHGRASLLTFEVEGSYWANPRPQVLPGEGNTVTAQMMWTELWYPWFEHGEIGYTQRTGSGPTSGWFINTSLGRAITPTLSAQLEVELDNQGQLDDTHRAMQGFVMPQIAWRWRPGWMVSLGEQGARQQGDGHWTWSTLLMLEHEF